MKRIIAFAATHELARAAGWIGAALIVAFGIATADKAMRTREADASRNSAGTMVPVNGPYTSGSVINSAVVNARLSDIEGEITNSLSRDAKGGMRSALRGIDGTVTAPAFSFTSETGSGLYRIGASDLGWAISGAKKLELTSSLFTVTPNMGVGAANPTTSNYTPFTVQGAGSQLAAESRVGVNTRLASNTYFDGASEKYVANGFGGILQIGGATSADWSFLTAPSGTAGNTASYTERMKINESGVTIGISGTAISASFRNTTVWDPPSLAAGSSASTTITLTGAAAGADCNVTPPSSISTPYDVVPTCWVTANTCNIQIVSAFGTNDMPSGTWACRVWNP